MTLRKLSCVLQKFYYQYSKKSKIAETWSSNLYSVWTNLSVAIVDLICSFVTELLDLLSLVCWILSTVSTVLVSNFGAFQMVGDPVAWIELNFDEYFKQRLWRSRRSPSQARDWWMRQHHVPSPQDLWCLFSLSVKVSMEVSVGSANGSCCPWSLLPLLLMLFLGWLTL